MRNGKDTVKQTPENILNEVVDEGYEQFYSARLHFYVRKVSRKAMPIRPD
jgi:hypothetical protein